MNDWVIVHEGLDVGFHRLVKFFAFMQPYFSPYNNCSALGCLHYCSHCAAFPRLTKGIA
jgi:hypothetical protein